MYVVRRAFRNYNQVIVPGSVVEPSTIKRFKTRLKHRYIVEVSEQNFNEWNEYFKVRFGTPIAAEAKPKNTTEVKPASPVKAKPAGAVKAKPVSN